MAEGLEVAVAEREAEEGVGAAAMAMTAEAEVAVKEKEAEVAVAAAMDWAVASGVSLGAGSVAEAVVGTESRLLLAGRQRPPPRHLSLQARSQRGQPHT